MEKHDITEVTILDDLSYTEALALEWTLSIDDINFILESVKGEKQLLYFAAQLKSLRNTGSFLNQEDFLSDKIITYLCKQLDIGINSLEAISRNTIGIYRQKIKDYLKYQDYTELTTKSLKEYLLQEMEKELYSIDVLKLKTHTWLKKHKIVRPSSITLDRMLASYRKENLDILYAKLANKLTIEQKSKLLSMLSCRPNLYSQVNYYKKSPSEPTSSKINTFICRFKELKELGITRLDFSDIAKAIFNKLVLLGKTYDSNALNQINSNDKKTALLLCSLVDASQIILDHILDMNDKLLAKKERISRNKFDKTLKSYNTQAKKGLHLLVETTKAWLSHEEPENITLLEFQKTINQKKYMKQ